MLRGAYNGAKWYAQVGNQFDRAYVTPLMSKTMNKVGGISKMMPAGLNNFALTAGLSVFMAESTFDPTIHDSKITEIGKQAMSMGVDNLAFAINPLLGLGMMAASMAGMPTPGNIAMGAMNAMGNKTDFYRYGRKTVTQNERTRRATSSNLAMLGQAGNFATLGNEAMIAHN